MGVIHGVLGVGMAGFVSCFNSYLIKEKYFYASKLNKCKKRQIRAFYNLFPFTVAGNQGHPELIKVPKKFDPQKQDES
jgi:hypothetical protein